MDLSLWDSSDAYGSGYNTEDYVPPHFSFGYGRGESINSCLRLTVFNTLKIMRNHARDLEPAHSAFNLFNVYFVIEDMLEEDALNEKSCIQVLKIWIDKADEDIVKLEDDLLILQCQLAWDDEDWSKRCSAALREKTNHLDTLIQSLKDSREDGLQLEAEELPPRLHDLLKPLLENYLSECKQTETSIIQIPVPPAVEHSNKKSEASTSNDNKKIEKNVCNIILKTYERKSKSTELEERKINNPQQKKDAVTTGFNASAPPNEVSENCRSKPNTPAGRRMPYSVHVKSEPADPMVEESSSSMYISKSNSRENDKAISKAKVIEDRILHEVKVTNSHLNLQETGSPISETVEVHSKKQRTEASSEVQKARVCSSVIIKNTTPLVNMKEKNTKFPETPEALEALKTEMKNASCSLNHRIERVQKASIKLEPQIQEQQRCGIATVVISQAKPISPSNPEGRRPQKKCKGSPESLQNSFLAERTDKGWPSTENLMGQKKIVVGKGMSKKGDKETQQQLNKNNIAGASGGTATPISLLQEMSKLSFSSQTTSDKEGQSSVMKQATTETTYGVKNVPEISPPCIKDMEKLTYIELREIAKSMKLRGYSKLRKEELRNLIFQEKKQGFSPANAI